MKRLKHKFEAILARLGARLVQFLSLEQAQALARFIGRWAYRLGVARRTAFENLKLAFPEKTEAERRAIARESYEQFATTMIELARMPAMDPAEIEAMFEFENIEVFETLKSQKRGAVCLSAHYGNWEWMGAALIKKGMPMTFMIGTQSNPEVDALFNEHRAKVGIRFVRIIAIRDVIRALKSGDFMAVLGDQDGDKWGKITRFFGAEVSTHHFWLAPGLRTGAAFLFGVPLRLGPRRHRVKVHLLPEPPEGLGEEEQSAFRLQAYNDLLEAAIREHPGMWLWMHHRFLSKARHRLEGEERARAERGEIHFDPARQAWLDQRGAAVEMKTWKS
jgi:KDO2-lipid IV(A) lauroyltransferase